MSIKELVIQHLDAQQIPYTLYEHPPVNTMEECLALPFVTDSVVFCKNILLCNRQKTDFYLYITLPNKPFRTADVSKKLQVSRLSFAPETALEERLHLHSGSLSPLALWWDDSHEITLVVDHDIHSAQLIAFHPCDHTATLVFSQDIFFRQVIPSLHCISVELHVPWPD